MTVVTTILGLDFCHGGGAGRGKFKGKPTWQHHFSMPEEMGIAGLRVLKSSVGVSYYGCNILLQFCGGLR